MRRTTVTDANTRLAHALGGGAAIAISIGYVIIIVLFARVGAPPTGGAAWLEYLAGRQVVWWAIIGLSVLTDLLFLPVALSLFLALHSINKTVVLIATGLVLLFVVLELAVNWSAIVAAAHYPAAVMASPLARVYAIGTLSTGFLLMGVVMFRGIFGKVTATLGIVTGMLGILAVAGLGPAVILNAVCATIWLALTGRRLWLRGWE
jgi:hypothetical protein